MPPPTHNLSLVAPHAVRCAPVGFRWHFAEIGHVVLNDVLALCGRFTGKAIRSHLPSRVFTGHMARSGEISICAGAICRTEIVLGCFAVDLRYVINLSMCYLSWTVRVHKTFTQLSQYAARACFNRALVYRWQKGTSVVAASKLMGNTNDRHPRLMFINDAHPSGLVSCQT